MLVSAKACMPNAILNTSPNGLRKHKREQVEYGSCWVCEACNRVSHVDFMLFVSILFALVTQREPGFRRNRGFISRSAGGWDMAGPIMLML